MEGMEEVMEVDMEDMEEFMEEVMEEDMEEADMDMVDTVVDIDEFLYIYIVNKD